MIIITKETKRNNNTHLAQGGIAAPVATYDNPNDHFEDTLVAGCHYNNEEVVRYLVEEGPKEINNLIERGMKFDGDETFLILKRRSASKTSYFTCRWRCNRKEFIRASYSRSSSIRYGSGTGNGARFYYRKR